MIALWAAAMYLVKNCQRFELVVAAVPAAFMSAVSCTYILMADEGFRIAQVIAYPVGIAFALVCSGIFAFSVIKSRRLHNQQKAVSNRS